MQQSAFRTYIQASVTEQTFDGQLALSDLRSFSDNREAQLLAYVLNTYDSTGKYARRPCHFRQLRC